MSPEQCRGRTVDARSDVFALGAILYELTTGRPAFSGESDLDILNRIATGQADPPTWAGLVRRSTRPRWRRSSCARWRPIPPIAIRPWARCKRRSTTSRARPASSVSAGALAAFMRALFADDIVAWQAAEKAGKSLAEHLATPTAAPRPVDPEDRTATDAFGPTRFRPRGAAAARRGRSRWSDSSPCRPSAADGSPSAGNGRPPSPRRSRPTQPRRHDARANSPRPTSDASVPASGGGDHDLGGDGRGPHAPLEARAARRADVSGPKPPRRPPPIPPPRRGSAPGIRTHPSRRRHRKFAPWPGRARD